MTDQVAVRPGQIWADKNRWNTGRTVRVVYLIATYAVVEVVTEAASGTLSGRCTIGRRSRIRFTDRGIRDYRLVTEAPEPTDG